MNCQSIINIKRWIRLTLVTLVGLLVFSLSMMDVALSAEIQAPIPIAIREEIDLRTGKGVALEYDPLAPRLLSIEGATVSNDITYSTLPGFRPLRLDLYRDTGVNYPRPLVVFVHGGSWTVGQKRGNGYFSNFPNVLAYLAKSGYVVASLEYRLSGEAPFPAAIKDVKAAVRFLRGNAPQFGIDPQKVALWGASAGANLTSLASFSCGEPLFKPEDPNKLYTKMDDCVQAFVGWYGPYDLIPLFGDPAAFSDLEDPTDPQIIGIKAFLKCTDDGVCPHNILKAASPVTYVDQHDPPMLLIHGTADTAVPYEQSTILEAKVKEVHGEDWKDWVELLLIEDVDHDFRGTQSCVTHLASMKALLATFTFLDKHFLSIPPEAHRWFINEKEPCPAEM